MEEKDYNYYLGLAKSNQLGWKTYEYSEYFGVPEFMYEYAQHEPVSALRWAGPKIKKDDKFIGIVLDRVTKGKFSQGVILDIYKNLPKKYRNNIDVLKKFVKFSPKPLRYTDIDLTKHKDVVLTAVELHSNSPTWIPDWAMNDPEICRIALEKHKYKIEYLEENLDDFVRKSCVLLARQDSSFEGLPKYKQKIFVLDKIIEYRDKHGINLQEQGPDIVKTIEVINLSIELEKQLNLKNLDIAASIQQPILKKKSMKI